MSQNVVYKPQKEYTLRNKVRFVTAASIFDGHDVSINVIRRMLQQRGVEVIHLGHNRSAAEIVDAAIQEDVHAVAISSYQGGHNEFYRYLVDLLRKHDTTYIKVFGGGGGVITPREARALEEYGVAKIYTPEGGRRMGLEGIITDMMETADFRLPPITLRGDFSQISTQNVSLIARLITQVENSRSKTGAELGSTGHGVSSELARRAATGNTIVIGITGTGGAGKSTLADEILLRLLSDFPHLQVAYLSVDPSKRKSGGALLGDRIRMNTIHNLGVYMRSLATRSSGYELPKVTGQVIQILRASGFDLIVVETTGIGQGTSAVVDISEVSLYVMAPEYGAASQLEKIDMLDFADLVAINKFDRRGSEDALRDVRKQIRYNRGILDDVPDFKLPVFGTIASQFGDVGMDALYLTLLGHLEKRLGARSRSSIKIPKAVVTGNPHPIIPEKRSRYLGEIVETVRSQSAWVEGQVSIARRLYQLHGAECECEDSEIKEAIHSRFEQLRGELHTDCWDLIQNWDKLKQAYTHDQQHFEVRGRTITVDTGVTTLSGSRIPKVALPRFEDWGEIVKFQLKENLPGLYPYTAGVYPFRRSDEAARRQFAGEGGPQRTNRRFHYLCRNDRAKRLSTAFDSVTIYGEDPDERPDIFGRIGEGGVSVATLGDIKQLFEGFELTHPTTSVSMTINGPAPMILAMFFNTAIDQAVEKFVREHSRQPNPEERERIKGETLRGIRGTVQADILKEDQAQNECIFSTEFALRMIGDVQQYFIDHDIRNFYSVSVSGYHIAEAGANPITQLVFTLANGFTYVEYYLERGMDIDDFAPNLSFFFCIGLDPEYSVIGRVARRIWAKVMKERYGANARGQKLKYHIQTSGRSLQAREIQFNDIRTTLEALTAIYDNCNSLHTNAYDEAITIPTEESVHRAVAIQQIIDHEFGMTRNENPLQGAYIMEELTDLVEGAVLAGFDRINERGGVLGAMELQYHRSRIQEESLLYERKKDSGELPIVGVNSPFPDEGEVRTGQEETSADALPDRITLTRATPEEKREQVDRLRAFQKRHQAEAPEALERLKRVARAGDNIFAELMKTVRVASLGQITHALYKVGGQYRRGM